MLYSLEGQPMILVRYLSTANSLAQIAASIAALPIKTPNLLQAKGLVLALWSRAKPALVAGHNSDYVIPQQSARPPNPGGGLSA
jgi:hypothetical protein